MSHFLPFCMIAGALISLLPAHPQQATRFPEGQNLLPPPPPVKAKVSELTEPGPMVPIWPPLLATGAKLPTELLPLREMKQFRHPKPVQSIRYLPDGNTLMTSNFRYEHSDVESICFWHSQSGKLLHKKDFSNPELEIGFVPVFNWCISPDGRWLAQYEESSPTLEVQELATGKRHTIKGHPHHFSYVEFSGDSKRLITGADVQRGPLRVFDVHTGKLLHHLPTVAKASFTPLDFGTYAAGKYLVGLGRKKDENMGLRIWDLEANRPSWGLSDYFPTFISFDFSPDAKVLAVATIANVTKKNCIRFYDSSTGKLLRDLANQTPLPDEQFGLVFSPDGKILATACSRQVQFWDVASGKLLKTFLANRDCVLAFAPKGPFVALGNGKKVILLDTITWKVRQELAGEFPLNVFFALCYLKVCGLGQPITFSPDGKRLLVAQGNTIRQWDVETGKEIQRVASP